MKKIAAFLLLLTAPAFAESAPPSAPPSAATQFAGVLAQNLSAALTDADALRQQVAALQAQVAKLEAEKKATLPSAPATK